MMTAKIVLTVLNGFLGISTLLTAVEKSKDEAVIWLLTFVTALCASNIVLFWRL